MMYLYKAVVGFEFALSVGDILSSPLAVGVSRRGPFPRDSELD